MLFQFFYRKEKLSEKILIRKWPCKYYMTVICQSEFFLIVYCFRKKIETTNFFSQLCDWLGILIGRGLAWLISVGLSDIYLLSVGRSESAGYWTMVSIVMTQLSFRRYSHFFRKLALACSQGSGEGAKAGWEQVPKH